MKRMTHRIALAMLTVSLVLITLPEGMTPFALKPLTTQSVIAQTRQNQLFSLPTDLPGSGYPSTAVATGDLDGDGDLDLILGNEGDTASQIYFNDGRGSFALPKELPPGASARTTVSVALGDLDGDKDLDLVLGNLTGLSQVSLNNGHGEFSALIDLPESGHVTYSVALGDLDNDNDLDIVLGKSYTGKPSKVYYNRGIGNVSERFPTFINLPTNETLANISNTWAVAPGDLDNDGDLDLVFGNVLSPGNRVAPSQVYWNAWGNSGKQEFSGPQALPDVGHTVRAVAVGDLDGKNGLDIVLGGAERSSVLLSANPDPSAPTATFMKPIPLGSGSGTTSVSLGNVDADGHLDIITAARLFKNKGDGKSWEALELPGSGRGTRGVAVADLNGDSRLDVILANFFEPSQVYYSNAVLNFSKPTDLSNVELATERVALGDLDGDGDLDLVLGNSGSPSQLYENNGGGSFRLRGPLPSSGRSTTSVALGDLDGDTDLDLVLGTRDGASQYYANTRPWIFATPKDLPASGPSTTSLALGDLDGDADLDLILGNTGYSIGGNLYDLPEIYWNDGKGGLSAPVELPASRPGTSSVALGDVNGDGTTDIVLSNNLPNSRNKIYLQQRTAFEGQPTGAPPTIHVEQPGRTKAANFYATAEVLGGPTIRIPFTLSHTKSITVATVLAHYSLDGGGSWLKALATTGTITRELRTDPDGEKYVFEWNITHPDGPIFGQSDNVIFRITAIPGINLKEYKVAGSYPYAGVRATSLPFRVRGTLARVVDTAGQPAPRALVYRLPRNATRDAQLLTHRLTGEPLSSDHLGFVNSRDPIRPGERLAALQVISDTATHTFYRTSPIALTSGLPEHVTSTGVQTITVSPARPLLALKLSISLEWDARADSSYVAELTSRLQRTSELLYDWTNGQVALGQLTIIHGRQAWEHQLDQQGNVITRGADIRIYASNEVRPNATQGGITNRVITETYTISPTLTRQLTYEPGHIRIGASWNSDGDPDRDVGEDWSRALAHEIGHFALFLDETYLGREGTLLVPVEGCTSPMGDPYIDSNSEFRPASDWPEACRRTLQHLATGLAEWEQISRFYTRTEAADGFDFHFNIPASATSIPGPVTLPMAITTFREEGPAGVPGPGLASYAILPPGGGRYEPLPGARAIIFPAGTRPPLDLGAPGTGLVQTRALSPTDQLCVFDPEARLAGCELTPAGLRLSQLPAGWRPEVRLTPETFPDSDTMLLTVTVPASTVGSLAPSQPLRLLFYPREGDLTPVPATLALDGADYRAELRLSQVVEDGLVRLWVEEPGARREALVDYAVGGNPAKKTRPPRRTRRNAPAVSADGQATLFAEELSFDPGQFFALQRVANLPKLPAWATVVGQGYRLLASDTRLLEKSLALSLSYPEGDVPQGLERDIRMLFNDGKAWRELPTRLDRARNEGVVRVEAAPGTYVLVTSVRLPLSRAGWNLIYSFPGASAGVPEALVGIKDDYSMVYGYNDDDTADLWKLYAPRLDPAWQPLVNDLAQLENGASYWVYATRPVTVPLRPELSSGESLTQAGGVFGTPPATYYGLAPAGAGAGALTVEAYVGDRAEPCGTAATQAFLFGGAPRQAFSLNVLANGGDELAGCGTPGAAVQLVFRDEAAEVGRIPAVWDNERLNPVGFPLDKRLYLPLIGKALAPQPDLTIVAVRMVPAPAGSGEAYEVLVTVRNAGAADITVPFWVDLYVDPDAEPEPRAGWPEVAHFGASWRVYGLRAGETTTLSSLTPNDPRDPGRNYSRLPAFLAGTTYVLWAQADVFSSAGEGGAVAESNEDNNIAGPTEATP